MNPLILAMIAASVGGAIVLHRLGMGDGIARVLVWIAFALCAIALILEARSLLGKLAVAALAVSMAAYALEWAPMRDAVHQMASNRAPTFSFGGSR